MLRAHRDGTLTGEQEPPIQGREQSLARATIKGDAPDIPASRRRRPATRRHRRRGSRGGHRRATSSRPPAVVPPAPSSSARSGRARQSSPTSRSGAKAAPPAGGCQPCRDGSAHCRPKVRNAPVPCRSRALDRERRAPRSICSFKLHAQAAGRPRRLAAPLTATGRVPGRLPPVASEPTAPPASPEATGAGRDAGHDRTRALGTVPGSGRTSPAAPSRCRGHESREGGEEGCGTGAEGCRRNRTATRRAGSSKNDPKAIICWLPSPRRQRSSQRSVQADDPACNGGRGQGE